MTNEPREVQITQADAIREKLIAAIGKADDEFSYSFNLTKLVDGVATQTLTMPGFDPVEFEDREDGYQLIAERRNAARTDAILDVLRLSHSPDKAVREALEGFIAWRDRVQDGEDGCHYLNGENPPFGNGDDGWYDLDRLAKAARAALADHPTEGAWVFVPREPTEAMQRATYAVPSCPGARNVAGIYRAMLSAIPSSFEGEG